MSKLKTLANPFQFNDLDIRTAIGDDHQVWFCAEDVCQALEIDWLGSRETLKAIPDDWVKSIRVRINKETIKILYFVNEPGIIQLIHKSVESKAIKFSRWLYFEVLQTLRKNNFLDSR